MRAEVVGRLAHRPLHEGRGSGRADVTGDRTAERGQRLDLVAGAIERGPDQLGHPGVEHDLALHVGAGAVTDVEDAGHQPAGTGDEEASRLDDEPPRSPVDRDRLEERRELPCEAFGARTGLAEWADRKAAAEVERVEAVESAPQQAQQRQPATHGIAPRIDRAELGPDVEVDPARNERAVGTRHALHRGRQLGFGHAELRTHGPDGQAGGRLRDDRRVEAEQHVERRTVRSAQTRPARDGDQRLGFVGRFDCQPGRRRPGCRLRAPRAAGRRRSCRSPRS